MIEICMVHEAPTPHNDYLFGELRKHTYVTLNENYFFGPQNVPGRPWKNYKKLKDARISYNKNRWFSPSLLWKASTDSSSVFFVIGWNHLTLVLLLIILGLRKRPLIIWDDGPDHSSLKSFGIWWLPKSIMKRILIYLINRTSGKYFHTGHVVRDDILALGVKEEKLENLPFFVRPGSANKTFRRDFSFSYSDFIVLAGGRLVESKGYDLLLDAIAKLDNQVKKSFKLLLVGSGPEESHLREIVVREELQSIVTFIPWADADKFATLVHSCDCFVAPARFDHFPTTVIAAMQAGIPVIASDGVGSAVEFITHNHNGIMTRKNSVSDLSIGLNRLIIDKESRLALGKRASKSMEEWSVDWGVEKIFEAARELV